MTLFTLSGVPAVTPPPDCPHCDPGTHRPQVCLKRTLANREARWLLGQLPLDKVPSPPLYPRFHAPNWWLDRSRHADNGRVARKNEPFAG